jgi:hypothetical protein
MKAFIAIGVVLSVILISGCVSDSHTNGEEFNGSKHCFSEYESTGECPDDLCEMQCVGNGPWSPSGCPKTCGLKACSKIDLELCPTNDCEIYTTCHGDEICWNDLNEWPTPECGGFSYNDQDVECCEGLIRKCGSPMPDGRCNTTHPYGEIFARCIPCGDGICGDFENKCNCPEDCNRDEEEIQECIDEWEAKNLTPDNYDIAPGDLSYASGKLTAGYYEMRYSTDKEREDFLESNGLEYGYAGYFSYIITVPEGTEFEWLCKINQTGLFSSVELDMIFTGTGGTV